MSRSVSRIMAMMAIYNYEQNKDISFVDMLDDDGFDDSLSYDKDYYEQIIKATIENISDIDYYIAKNLDNYSIDRLNLVDLSIVRVAVCEMVYLNIPYQVAINEAVEISKEYSTTETDATYKFNNSLLDKIRKDLGL